MSDSYWTELISLQKPTFCFNTLSTLRLFICIDLFLLAWWVAFFLIHSNHSFPISSLFNTINLTLCTVSPRTRLPIFQCFASVSHLHPEFCLPFLIGLSIMHNATQQTGLVPLWLPRRWRGIDQFIPDTMVTQSMNILSRMNFIQRGQYAVMCEWERETDSACSGVWKTKNNMLFGSSLLYNRNQHSELFPEHIWAHLIFTMVMLLAISTTLDWASISASAAVQETKGETILVCLP